MIIPLVVIPVNSSNPVTGTISILAFSPASSINDLQLVESAGSSTTHYRILPILFLVSSTFLLIRFIYNIWNIIGKTTICKKIEMGKLSLVLTEENILPYSFFKYIFINKSYYEQGKIDKELLIHEEAHCLQYHSIDIILLELIIIFFWFNPFIWIFRNAIILNHEYCADNKVLENNEPLKYHQLLVNAVIRNNSYNLVSNFRHPLIKNRIIMMTKSRPQNNAIMRKIATIPLFLIMAMTVTFSQGNKQRDGMIDFTGKWVLNKLQSKSLLTEVATSTINITQGKNSITMDINITPNDGNPVNRTEKYVFNESIVRKNTKGDKTTVLTCTPAPDGQSFSITDAVSGLYNGIEKEGKRISVYNLSNDGKQLIIKVDDILPEGSITPESERHETRVYDKVN
jgi:hypothetical protein